MTLTAKTVSESAPRERIPVYRPDLSGNERKYALECIDSSWISSIGIFIDKFEASIAEFTGSSNAIAVCNGTVALHLALHCLDIGPGDEVIVPTFTYIASVNTIAQTGAVPVFVESRPGDWLLDPAHIERRITARTKAIMAVHLYGAACDMDAICGIARRYGLKVIEDCAEALGTRLDGRHVGTFGDVGTFSFFGNKTVTTGEGGMVIAQDATLAQRLRRVKGQGQSLDRRYWHDILGFNYRMTNIAAAIGYAQMERVEEILARKQEIARVYRRAAQQLPVEFQVPLQGVVSSDWLVSLLLPAGTDRDRLMKTMDKMSVETRPVFYPAHHMPMYHSPEKFTVAEDIAARGLSLPSFPALSDADISYIVATLGAALSEQGLK